ncbi:MAG: cadherin domain-containing protein [Gemmataceae bacterium]
MKNWFAFLKSVVSRNHRRVRKSKPVRRPSLALLLLEDRLTPAAPGFLSPSYLFSVPENSAIGTIVGSATATDADAGQTLTYSIVNGNTDDAFAIDSSGQITVNKAVLDFESVNQSYSLQIQAADNGTPVESGTATVTINLTDVTTFITINDVAGAEFDYTNGTTAFNFIVTSSSAVGRPFTLQASTANGTAIGGTDFETRTATPIDFWGGGNGETHVLTAWVKCDTTGELDETFFVNLTGPADPDIVLLDAQGQGTIQNDDTATFTIGDVSVSESAGSATFQVSLSRPLEVAAKVNVTFTNGSTSANDFDHTTRQVTFPAGTTGPLTVTVPGLADTFAELDETFTATLSLDASTPLTGYAVEASDASTGTITDDDTTVVLGSIAEDTTAPAGATVSTVLGPTFTGKGMAVVAVDNTNGQWQYSINGGLSWSALSASAGRVDLAATARLLSDVNKIRFVPSANFNGTVSLVYRVWDRTGAIAGSTVNLSGGGDGTRYALATSSARLTVTPSNDAPELLFGVPYLTPVGVSDPSPAGDTVASFAGSLFTDRDVGQSRGIAVVTLVGGNNGTWQYSIDNGTTWKPIGAVTNLSALLLFETDKVRFLPKSGFTGSAALYFRAWDGTNGADHGARANVMTNGGKTAYSWITKTATVWVLNNTAPTLSPGVSNLTTINEGVTLAANTGTLVSGLTSGAITDDVGANRGIAVVSVDNTNGVWQYSTNNGVWWYDISSVRGRNVDLSAEALLLSDVSKVRFLPNLNYNGTASFVFRAWDRSYGTIGWDADLRQSFAIGGRSAFSTGTRTATITVNAVNDAPVLAVGSPTLTQVSTMVAQPGDTVDSLVGTLITDPDGLAVPKGMAIIATSGVNGVWEYSINGGTSYLAIGTVSAASALLLRDVDLVRFRPTVSIYLGTATITYRAWDQTGATANQQGTKMSAASVGGITPFSAATQVATMQSYNDAPVLAAGSPILPSVTTNTPLPTGQTVASFVGSFITDQDPSSLRGIAVTTTTGVGGVWQYSTNGGTTYTPIGAVSWLAGLLLRDTDLVRFVPSGTNFVGTATLNYRAWDQTGFTAGGEGTKMSTAKTGLRTPFSNGTQTAVVRSNNAPSLAFGPPSLPTYTGATPAWRSVGTIAGSFISDADAGALKGIAVTNIDGSNGTWQYSLDGGSTITSIGTVSPDSALLLRDTDVVRFLPNTAGWTGSAPMTYRAWDQSGTTVNQQGTKVSVRLSGDFYPFSTASQTVTFRSNESPGIYYNEPILPSVTSTSPPGQTVASFLSGFTDQDGDPKGIAITEVTGTNGVWEYSTNGGTTYSAIGAVSAASSLLLRDTDLVRFKPNAAGWVGSATITYRAWDQTGGTVASKVSTAVVGNPTPFSMTTQTATVRSNNAPTLQVQGSDVTLNKVSSLTPPGQTVASFANVFITDREATDLKGIAVTSTVGYDGVWEYSLDGGTTYAAMPAVSGSQSLLLRDVDLIRFRPTAAVYHSTTPSILYRAWDRTTGTAGTQVSTDVSGDYTAFSGGQQTAVARGNIAPVLATTGVTLPKISTINPLGSTVASFAAASTTDADVTDLEGIAVTATGGTNGVWEYSTNGGSTYTAIGAVSGSASLLLRDTDLIRFNPTAAFTGSATITYRAWDRTTGTAGQKVDTTVNDNYTPFSAAQATATVYPNAAPVLTTGGVSITGMNGPNPTGQQVASFAVSAITDADGDPKGIAITGLTGSNGVWEYSIDGGTTYTAIGTVSATASLLLRDTDLVRFRPTGGANGTATITYRAWDRTGVTAGLQGQKVSTSTNGTFTPFSTGQATASAAFTQ